MRSKFNIGGHPIHAALVALPIGLFAWAFFADIVYIASDDNQTWYDIAYWSGIGGIVTALAAALFGFADLFTIGWNSDARPVALTHMGLNLATVACFFVAALFMYDDGATGGGALTVVVILHALGVGMLALSGWLGGEMVYRFHLGMVPDDGQREREEHARHERTPARRPELRGR